MMRSLSWCWLFGDVGRWRREGKKRSSRPLNRRCKSIMCSYGTCKILKDLIEFEFKRTRALVLPHQRDGD